MAGGGGGRGAGVVPFVGPRGGAGQGVGALSGGGVGGDAGEEGCGRAGEGVAEHVLRLAGGLADEQHVTRDTALGEADVQGAGTLVGATALHPPPAMFLEERGHRVASWCRRSSSRLRSLTMPATS